MELTIVWQFLSIFGSIEFWIGTTAAVAIVHCFLPKKIKNYSKLYFFGVLPAVVISCLIAEGMKLVFQVPRPCVNSICPLGYSFPSGHTAIIFAAMTVATVHSKNKKLYAVFLGFALLVALSRVFLGYHRIEDVIAGSLIGTVVGYLVYRNYKKILQKVKFFLR